MKATPLRLPAEWEPQSGVLIAWPHADTDWGPRLAEVEATYVALASAIARFEPLLICVRDAALRDHAAGLLASLAGHSYPIHFVDVAYDDTWLRDSGPITLLGQRPCLLDFRFTGWGGKYGASQDDALVAALREREVFSPDCDLRRIDFALEGGAIDSDGQGSLLTTWACLHQRHPQRDRASLCRLLADELQQDRVLMLDRGYLEGDDTDAHIDTLARFAPDDTILYQGCDDPDDSHHAELAAMGEQLAALRTVEGRAYRLLTLPWARPIRDGARRLAASYANFLIVNGAVLVPAYGDPADEGAQRVVAQAFPDRQIVPIPCRALIWQNGSLHCVTMQLPQGVLRV